MNLEPMTEAEADAFAKKVAAPVSHGPGMAGLTYQEVMTLLWTWFGVSGLEADRLIREDEAAELRWTRARLLALLARRP